MTPDYSKQKDGYIWVFFAGNAKPTSMRQALAQRLSEEEPVVIVHQPISLLRRRKLPTIGDRCERLSGVNKPWHYRPMYFPERLPGVGKFLRHLNQRLLKQELDSLVPRNAKRIICYDSPTQDQLVGKLGEDLSVYIAVDEKTLTVQGEPIRGEIGAEKRLLSRVDKVICVSETLAEVLRSRVLNGRTLPIQVLPNGYDEGTFDPKKSYLEPSALTRVPKPRILVAGHISERIDWEGIREASQSQPKWTWVFVGPPDPGIQERILNDLGSKGFCHPPVPLEEVPAWIQNCDVCAVPYRLNRFTQASHPLKALEYLAMGKPVLSTRVPSLESYDAVVEWVDEGDGASYIAALNKIRAQSNDSDLEARRRQAVANDTWSDRVCQFLKIVSGEVSKKPRSSENEVQHPYPSNAGKEESKELLV